MRSNPLLRAAVAEAIGAFALIFIGVLSISSILAVRGPTGFVNLTGVAFAHGLTILVMVAALGAVSGGHFNPAITLGFVVTGRMNIGTGALYWLAQIVGASLAGFLLVAMIGQGPVAVGTPDLGRHVSMLTGIAAELVGSFFLVLVVFGTAVDGRAPKSVYPIAIGLTITLDILAIGPLTGSAVNPARAFGPALASGHWANQLVYWIGPLTGGALAAILESYFFIQAPPVVAQEPGGPTPEEERRAA